MGFSYNIIMLSQSVISELKGIVGASEVLTSREDLLTYSFDGTAMLNQMPAVVVFPKNADEISRILRIANRDKIPVVPRGSGTCLSGGAVPEKNSIVLCTVKFNRLLEVDEKNLTILTEPGVTTLQIDEAASKIGLLYPPDPGSMKISTIGGNVAENSGGLRGLKYGVTRDYVMGLEVVLPSGEILRCGGKSVKDVAGYSLKDLFIGSEGTLGIITRILLKLIPRPQARKTLLATYATMTDAAETVSAIIEQKIIPCTCEFLDRTTIRCVEDFAKIGLPLDVESILLIETDGHPAVVENEAALIEKICRTHAAVNVKVAQSVEEATKLASARRSAFSALARVSPTTILEDATVPRSQLATMLRFIDATAKKYNLKIGTFGHMGDGNLHPTFLTDERNHDEIHRVEAAFKEIFQKAIELGGTITGEHGIGTAKKPFLVDVAGTTGMKVMQNLKQTFDPNNILNPGKVLDLQWS